MDDELDLLDRGPGRGEFPLELVQVARYGVAVAGLVVYDQMSPLVSPLVSLAELFACRACTRRRCTPPL